MGNLNASYRIVYFQPNPEDGDRVSVALLFTANNDVDILYDHAFPKLKCLAPHIDPDIIRYQLDYLATGLRERGADQNSLVAQQAPQLTTSEPRKVAWPLTNQVRMRLVRRFLSKEGYVSSTEAAERREKVDPVQIHLRQLLSDVTPRLEEWRENAKPEWVIGEKVSRIRPVALALRKNQTVVIVDGVDLSAMTTQSAVTRVGKVAYTFFQYGRVTQMDFARRSLRRIGVVLNGATRPGRAYRDTHDFAMQEFSQEADLAIDAGSPEGVNQLKNELISE
jgi:hypothetical protein